MQLLFTWTKLIACRPFLRVAIHLSNASSERLLKCTKNILRYKYAMIEIQKILTWNKDNEYDTKHEKFDRIDIYDMTRLLLCYL